jgi:hypothetical protein
MITSTSGLHSKRSGRSALRNTLMEVQLQALHSSGVITNDDWLEAIMCMLTAYILQDSQYINKAFCAGLSS